MTVMHTESSLGWGGQEIRVFTELVHLRRLGYRVGLICDPGGMLTRRAQAAGLPTWELRFGGPFGALACWRIYRILRQEQVRIVNTHSSRDSWIASLAARIARVRVVRTRHLSIPVSRNPFSRLVYSHLCDRIVTTGERIRQLLLRDLRLDPAKVIAVPTGIPVEVFDPRKANGAKVRREFGLGGGIPLIGMVAVLRSWKGHRVLLEAAPVILSEVPQARFLLVGDGPQRENILRWIGEMGLQDRVALAGHREDIPDVLAALDVVVSASTAAEGVPQALLQALAMERAVVATDVGGVGEVIRDGETGRLIPARDPQALAGAVVALLRAPATAAAAAAAGRRLVEKEYRVERMMEKLETLYRDLWRGVRGSDGEARVAGIFGR